MQTGIIALIGGDEFREDCRDMDRHILSLASRPEPHVVILPTAAAFENPQLAARNGVRYFNALGVQARAAMVLDSDGGRDPAKTDALEHADMIYITGGDPWHLLSVLKDSPAWHAIVTCNQKGGIIAGSSAGAMVLSEKMRTQDSQGWIDALNLVSGIAVLPHHETPQPDTATPLRNSLDSNISLIGIPAATACIYREHQTWHVAGKGNVTLYKKHAHEVYGNGQYLPLN